MGPVTAVGTVAAVAAVVAGRQRTLLVARTGFGKSAVYFSATRMLRDRGWGPTIVVSPLLALMRDQVASAGKLGLAAETINSSNLDAWDGFPAARDRLYESAKASRRHDMKSPGSVAVVDKGRFGYQMLVCLNYSKRIAQQKIFTGFGDHRAYRKRIMI